MARPNISHIEFSRKPAQFEDVYTTVKRSAVPADLPVHTAAELGLFRYCLSDFAMEPDATVFLLARGAETYLVNAEGYTYARYITKVID